MMPTRRRIQPYQYGHQPIQASQQGAYRPTSSVSQTQNPEQNQQQTPSVPSGILDKLMAKKAADPYGAHEVYRTGMMPGQAAGMDPYGLRGAYDSPVQDLGYTTDPSLGSTLWNEQLPGQYLSDVGTESMYGVAPDMGAAATDAAAFAPEAMAATPEIAALAPEAVGAGFEGGLLGGAGAMDVLGAGALAPELGIAAGFEGGLLGSTGAGVAGGLGAEAAAAGPLAAMGPAGWAALGLGGIASLFGLFG